MANLPEPQKHQNSIDNLQPSENQKWWEDYKMNSKEIFDIVNHEIQYEHNLIAHRMSWYVTSQSFLMTAFAVSGGNGHQFVWLEWLLPLLGIVTSFIIWLSLRAAIRAMERARKFRKQIFDKDDKLKKLELFSDRYQRYEENECDPQGSVNNFVSRRSSERKPSFKFNGKTV